MSQEQGGRDEGTNTMERVSGISLVWINTREHGPVPHWVRNSNAVVWNRVPQREKTVEQVKESMPRSLTGHECGD